MDIEIPPFPDFATEVEAKLKGAVPRLELFDVGDEDGNIPPREWLLGTTYCRGNLSGLISAGAGGKTTVRILQALSLASGRELTGEHVFVRSRVMIICLEDNMTELRRRVRAAMLYHKVTPAEVKGFLILTTPRGLKIAERDEKGRVAAGALHRALSVTVDELKLDLALRSRRTLSMRTTTPKLMRSLRC
jgi:RecA-family ATPase